MSESRQGSGADPEITRPTLPPAPESLLEGSTLGRCRIGRQIGQGGMGRVFEGRHLHTGAKVAVKVVAASNPHADRLVSEPKFLAKVNHPAIVKVVDAGRDDGFVWMAMEFVEGSSLAARIAARRRSPAAEPSFVDLEDSAAPEDSAVLPRGPSSVEGSATSRFDLRRAIEEFRSLARGLHALHEVGVLHRDVKPANIIIGPEGEPHLVDLGLATQLDDQFDERGRLAGTLLYMAPEQTMAGYAKLEPATDLYSLAGSFHEYPTLFRHAAGLGKSETLKEVALRNHPEVSKVTPDLPRSLDPIFRHALARHPSDRYRSGAELAEDLERWLDGRPPRHAPETWIEVLHRRRRVAIAVGGLVLTLLLAFASREVARRQERARDLDGLQDLFARSASDPEAAEGVLDRAAALADDYRDDSRFHSLVQDIVSQSAEEAVLRQLAYQGMTLRSLTSESRHRRLADRARRLFAIAPNSSLLFQWAFSAMLGDPEAARRLLADPEHESIVARSPLLRRFRRHLDRVIDPTDEPGSRTDEDGANIPGDTELCFRGFELLRHNPRPLPPPVAERISAFESEISEALRDLPGGFGSTQRRHQLLIALRAQARLALDRPKGALEDATILGDLARTKAERAGSAYLQAMAAARMADQARDEGEIQSSLRASVGKARECLRAAPPPVLGSLIVSIGANEVDEPHWRKRKAWLDAMLEAAEFDADVFDLDLEKVRRWLVQLATRAGEPTAVIEIFEKLSWPPPQRFVGNDPDSAGRVHGDVLNYYVWAVFHLAEEETDRSRSLALLERALRVFAMDEGRCEGLPLEARCGFFRCRAHHDLLDETVGIEELASCIEAGNRLVEKLEASEACRYLVPHCREDLQSLEMEKGRRSR